MESQSDQFLAFSVIFLGDRGRLVWKAHQHKEGASRHLSPFSGAGDTQSSPCPCLCPRLLGEHVWLWKISRRVELEFWILIPSCSVRHAGRIVSLKNVFTIAAVFYQTQVLSLSCLVRHEVIPSATFLWDLTVVTLVCEDAQIATFKGISSLL